jgi:hypothetical protein
MSDEFDDRAEEDPAIRVSSASAAIVGIPRPDPAIERG